MGTNDLAKQEQNTKAWQEDQALARFQMISPLLDESLDQAKRVELILWLTDIRDTTN